MSPRLHPIDFFENLGRSRSLIHCRKNLKKIRRKATVCELNRSKFHCRISNGSPFLRLLTNSSKKIWGRPCSPAPAQKNLENILGMWIDNVLRFTKFRWLCSIHFWINRLSTFWEFPFFQNRKINFSQKLEKKIAIPALLRHPLFWCSLSF